MRRSLLRKAVIANVPGDGGRAVQLTLNNGFRVFFSARDPLAMCERIRDRNPNIIVLA
ncbi:hypothetical protein D3C83_300160 [compost metagenome]